MRACVFLADGFEEIEGLTVVDILRRAGVETRTVSITEKRLVTGSHQIPVTADSCIKETDFSEAELLVLPGGMPGTKNLEACKALTDQLKRFYESGRLIGAICAAPQIFGHLGFLKNRKACIYPGMESELIGAEVTYDPVVQSDNVITSRGMGTAIAFGLQIIANLLDQKSADELAAKIVYR